MKNSRAPRVDARLDRAAVDLVFGAANDLSPFSRKRKGGKAVCSPKRQKIESVADYNKFILELENEGHIKSGPYDDREHIYATTGFREFTKEERLIYDNEIQNTGGFDVDVPPKIYGHGVNIPYSESELEDGTLAREVLDYCSEFAIKRYNKDNEKAFKFLKVVKAAYEVCCMVQYITFQAKQGDQTPETFQAVVFSGVHDCMTECRSCRIKPT